MEEVSDKDEPIGRSRNTILEVLTEGDAFILDGEYFHVSSGEVYVYADKTIDKKQGELAEISPESLPSLIAQQKRILNIDEL